MAIALSSEIIIGIIGAILLIVAWVWETWEDYKAHKISMHLHFSILYVAGNLFLVYYSWKIGSLVFFILNIILILAILAETVYSVFATKKWHRR